MSYGYNGRILRVDLSQGIQVEEPSEEFYRFYLGGSGFISYYLLKELAPDVEPLAPENKLIFAAGVVTGAPISGSGRNSVGAKSPLTGAFGEAEVGGYWGVELKRAGYDAIIIEGKAPQPVYLWIKDGEVEIKDARNLWGKPTWEARCQIIEELGGDRNIRIAQIGPAGERLVRYACIPHDITHFAGRTGMGAVMGSKNLKAIAVRGHNPVAIADPESLSQLAKWLRDNVMSLHRGNYDQGTLSVLFGLNRAGGLPTRNFQEGHFPEAIGTIDGRTMRDTILKARRSCWACAVRCKREVEIAEPYHVYHYYGGPEYETVASLGSNCGITDLAAISKASEMCNGYGLDTISTGVCIAFAMECFERGILTKKDTDGIELRFGNTTAMLAMVERIAQRQGLGDVLAEGVARAADRIGRGAEQYALHIKGQEVPMHEPRYKAGLGMGYAVSPTGADHCHNMHDSIFTGPSVDLEHMQSIGTIEAMPSQELSANKARLLSYVQTWRFVQNSLVMCDFVLFSPNQVVDITRAVTGWDTSLQDLLKVGERVINLSRAFNIREGLGRKDDYLPGRFFSPFVSGPLEGIAIDPEAFDGALDSYYGIMGWDKENGAPSLGKLEELGIGWAWDEIMKRKEF